MLPETESASPSPIPGSGALLEVSVCLSALENEGVIFLCSCLSHRQSQVRQTKVSKLYGIRLEECIFPCNSLDEKLAK